MHIRSPVPFVSHTRVWSDAAACTGEIEPQTALGSSCASAGAVLHSPASSTLHPGADRCSDVNLPVIRMSSMYMTTPGIPVGLPSPFENEEFLEQMQLRRVTGCTYRGHDAC